MATINFTPLYGVHSKDDCVCYFLEIDEVGILLDCGWTDAYDVSLLQPLERMVDKIDLVLLSHCDMAHMGALPYLVGTLKCKAPIYGTLPTFRMGQIMLYDAYQAKMLNAVSPRAGDPDVSFFDLDDIDAVFEQFKQLKYSEKLTLTLGKGDGMIITPHNAGHLIGGSLWKIVKEQESILYAVDYNHRTEHVLSKCALASLTRPTVLITDSMRLFHEQPKLKDRDSQIMSTIMETIRRGGNVLIPVDSSGRVLELMRVLDQYWIQHKLRDPIALLHHMSFYVSKAAQAMLEWCNDKITRDFDIGRATNPFKYTNIHLLHALEDLDKLPSPKVVLASSPSFDCGFSKELLLRWGSDPKNLVLFPNASPSPSSLAHQILTRHQHPPSDDMTDASPPPVYQVHRTETVPLSGAELLAHEKKERRRAHAELDRLAKEEEESAMEKMILGIDSDDSEGEADELLVKDREKLRGSYKVGFGQFTTAKDPMFFYADKKTDWDAYGEIINPEDYMDKVLKATLAARRKTNAIYKEDETAMAVEASDPLALNGPTKVVASTIALTLKAQIACVDFNGLVDGRAIKNYIASLKPRKLILIHGTAETTAALAEFALKSMPGNCEAVLCPKALECIDIESDTNVYKLQIKETLYSGIHFEPVGTHEVAFIDATMDFPPGASLPMLERAPGLGHVPLLLSQGNVKLDAVKQTLASAGITSRFQQGMLVCGAEGIVLKRTRANCIAMEGQLSENYFNIRALLYSQYTLI